MNCPKCGKELKSVCPECGKPVEVYSRVVGYMRPVSCWNPGKAQEFIDRKTFIIRNGDHVED